MNVNEIKELLHSFDQSSVQSLDVKMEQFELHLSKNKTASQMSTTTVQSAPTAEIQAEQVQVSPVETVESIEAKPLPEATGTIVPSPIVGVVYLSSAPGKPAYKKVGDQVAVGDTLCIVEAMKLMNEITSDIAGTVAEVLVENEEMVEYGQPLFRII